MSGDRDDTALAIDDARALMDALLASDWQELHVRSEGLEIFLAREGGGPNPMLAGAAQGAAPGAVQPTADRHRLTAPHVATVTWVAEVGTVLAAGQPAIRLAVLGDETDMPTKQAGRVSLIHAEIGQLVEFGQCLLEQDAVE